MSHTRYGYRPVHPGELLREEIRYRKLKRLEVAKQMGVPYTVLNDILTERQPLTATTAILIEAVLGIRAEMMMRMQLGYNMQVARGDKELTTRVAQIQELKGNPPWTTPQCSEALRGRDASGSARTDNSYS